MQSRSDLGSRPQGPTSTGPTSAANTTTLEPGTGDASSRGAFQRTTTRLAGLVLLVAVAAGLLGQGAYYPSVQRPAGLLLAAATVLALAAWPPTRGDARFLLVPTLALAAWAVLDAALLSVPLGSAVGLVLLLLGVVAVVVVCRRLSLEDREVLLLGVNVIGLLVALAGWLGVAGRVGAWAWEGDGIWRASSTLSYPNATAAVLVPLAMLVLARLIEAPRSLLLVLTATGLLAGLGATMSRAGALGFAVGLIALAWLHGPGRTTRAAVGPCVGALVATSCLVPSMPAASPPRPALALVGLFTGLALAAIVARLARWPMVAVVLGALLLGGVGAPLVIGGQRPNDAVGTVAQARITLASPDRSTALRAALRVTAEHPLTGTGPGHADLQWKGPEGVTRFFGYAHNEYVQLAAELGLVGLTLLALLLVALARLLWSTRATTPAPASWAGAVAATAAFAAHSSFDFVWHLPAVVLTVLLLTGVVLPAPACADAPQTIRPPVRSLRRESDESQN
jgi:O-Antigen ligase